MAVATCSPDVKRSVLAHKIILTEKYDKLAAENIVKHTVTYCKENCT
jgi:hypothetical protein